LSPANELRDRVRLGRHRHRHRRHRSHRSDRGEKVPRLPRAHQTKRTSCGGKRYESPERRRSEADSEGGACRLIVGMVAYCLERDPQPGESCLVSRYLSWSLREGAARRENKVVSPPTCGRLLSVRPFLSYHAKIRPFRQNFSRLARTICKKSNPLDRVTVSRRRRRSKAPARTLPPPSPSKAQRVRAKEGAKEAAGAATGTDRLSVCSKGILGRAHRRRSLAFDRTSSHKLERSISFFVKL
jgi:hypothetical protein